MVRRARVHTASRIAGAASATALSGAASLANLQIAYLPPERLRAAPNNARTHSKKQLKQIARSIERFGFVNPVLVSDDFGIIAGHGRVEAAKILGLGAVPTVRLSNLSPADRRAYAIADNRLAELSGWDAELLASELQGLLDLQFDDIELTGFSLGEIDQMLGETTKKKAEEPGAEDELPANSLQGPAVSRPGDVWVLGPHRLFCGDAREPASYRSLLEGKQADLVLTDPLSDIAITGDVCGLGRIDQASLAMASGESSEDQLIAIFTSFLRRAKENTKDGAVLFLFVDWRHFYALITASRAVGLPLEDLVVWAKDGTTTDGFYRSRHELVLMFKNGDAPHTNTAERGRHGRHRTNIWEYAGVKSFPAGRPEDLAQRPTVKPTALVVDAIRDVTRRGDIVLDPFAGNGTTIIAAEKTGRHGRAIELDPLYCDLIIRRWQQYTGKAARLEGPDLIFEEVAATRLAGQSASTAQSRRG